MSSDQWKEDCLKWRGRVLTGNFQHWCCDWDDLPIDDTCPEWPCGCAETKVAGPIQSSGTRSPTR